MILKLCGRYLCLSMYICFIRVSLVSFTVLKCLSSAYFVDIQGEDIFHFKESILTSTAFLQLNSSTLNVLRSLDTS